MARWQTQLQNVLEFSVRIFMTPGEFILIQLAILFPQMTPSSLAETNSAMVLLPAAVSLLCWLVIAIILWAIVAEIRNLGSRIARLISRLFFRFQIRQTYLCNQFKRFWHQRFLQRPSESTLVAGETEFDGIDMAVLRCAAACGPGFLTSAPDVAEALGMLPGNAQHCLDKLCHNKLVESTVTATDDFTNYRLTRSGQSFLSMSQYRNQ